MSLPFKITTIGNQNTRNVFRVSFSTALALPPKIEAWDNAKTFPKRTTYGATTAKQIFVGTAGNGNIPMLYAVATTNAAPGANWKPTAATAGGVTKNRLKGSTNYIVDPTTPGAGESITFNLGAEVPCDALMTTGLMDFSLQVRYFFSGSAPIVTLAGNSGTETSPNWETITPELTGIQLCDLSVEGDYNLTLPESGTTDAQVAWITYKSSESDTCSGDARLTKNITTHYHGNTNLKKDSASAHYHGDAMLETIHHMTGNAFFYAPTLAHFHGDTHLD